MLKHINLKFFDDHFNDKDGTPKITLRSQMLYIRVIIKHFRTMEATHRNMANFKLTETDLPWTSFGSALTELEKNGLISIDQTSEQKIYRFINKWEVYIDKSKIEPTLNKNTIHKFEYEMRNNTPLIKLIELRDGLKDNQINKAFELFFLEQKALEKEYPNVTEAKSHFINWVRVNIDYLKPVQKTNSAKGTAF